MTRRAALDRMDGLGLDRCEHRGLAWHHLLASHDKTGSANAYHHHVRTVASLSTPKVYRDAFLRWDHAITSSPGTIQCVATTRSRTVIGLGNLSPIDVGVALHHTYGVPYLPGTALKGLTRRAADQLELSTKDKHVLFGDETTGHLSQGFVTFWDGWLDPAATGSLRADVITVHHPSYYGSRGATPPTDFDDPNPVPFLSIPTNVRFHVALSCPSSPEWAQVAAEVLTYGLQQLGLGGKTAVGYGTMSLEIKGGESA